MYSKQLFIKHLILAGVVVLAFGIGCDDGLLQTVPKDRLSSETFWNTEEEAELAANDLYNFLGGTFTLVWDGMSDIAIPNNIWLEEVEYVRGQHDGESQAGKNHWNSSYRAIRAANNFLANADRVYENSEAPVDEDLINRLKAEARFVRAYRYIQLVTIFGDVPLVTTPLSIEEGHQVQRADAETIWDFIEAELQESADVLPPEYTGDDTGRITKGAALAFKARAMLYAGRYTEAHEAAEEVMGLGYSLYPSYENLFSYAAENNDEVILDRQYIANDKANNLFGMLGNPAMGIGESNAPVPTKEIVDAYEMENGMGIDETGSGYDPFNPYENRDPRLGYSIYVLGDELPNGNIYDPRPGMGGPNDIENGGRTTNTGFNIKKYVAPEDRDTPGNGGLNIILMRYAEVLLTYAEAKIEANDIDQTVYDAINEVRNGRDDVNMPDIGTGLSQDELREAVRHERMVELAFEGQRFNDIRRWRIAEGVFNRDNGNIYGLEYEDPDNPGELVQYVFSSFRRRFDPHHYVWPIPQDELDMNTNGMEQNPDY